MVHAMFESKDVSLNNGWYGIWLCVGGDWRLVQINDFLPSIGENLQPVFMHYKNDPQTLPQIWPSLIEKAYAKVYDGYDKLAEGKFVNTLQDLTGAPCEVVLTKNSEQLWKTLELAV